MANTGLIVGLSIAGVAVVGAAVIAIVVISNNNQKALLQSQLQKAKSGSTVKTPAAPAPAVAPAKKKFDVLSFLRKTGDVITAGSNVYSQAKGIVPPKPITQTTGYTD